MCSSRLIEQIHKESGKNPGFAKQKFNRLIARGFAKNGVNVETLSVVHRQRKGWKNLILIDKREEEGGVVYRYIPLINLFGLKHIIIFLYTFFFVLFYGFSNRKDKKLVFDVLDITVCLGGLLASKINHVKTCGIMTDMPGLMVGLQNSKISSLAAFVNKRYLTSFDYYVFLTEAMNHVINKKNRSYIVMEGLVDPQSVAEIKRQNERKSIIYAGGLFERYGIKMLIEAFMQIPDNNIALDLYGSGPMVETIKEYCNQDSRIHYHGVVSNDTIVKKELEAKLLVNPRPTTEAFTKYSFPSKNMEYMLSGTALLTTNLPGMPKDYRDYVYIFDAETTVGYANSLRRLLALSEDELSEKGLKARNFVLQTKNNVIQSKRILNLIK